MGRLETDMGGSRDAFPETAWSMIVSSPGTDEARRRERMDRLIQRYWRPVYKYVRAAGDHAVDDAKDLTQEFFLQLLDRGGIEAYQPRQGRFRHYLKGAVRHFLANERRDARAEKRGGGRPVLSLDVEGLETEKFVEERRHATPEQIFDRQWAQEHLAGALEKLERTLKEAGQALRFQVFHAHALRRGGGARPTYEDVAAEFKIGVWDVKYHLEEARAKLNDLLIESISDSVSSREDLIREMTELFSG